MEPRGKLTVHFRTREGKVLARQLASDACFLVECDSGRHPRARNAQLPTRPQREKRVGSAFPKASVAVRLYVRRTSDLAQHSELHTVQLAGYRRVDWQVNKRLQGRTGYHTGASVSSSSSRRVPKLFTGSARVMLSEGNFRQRRFSSCIGCLDCGRSPSDGSANCRSLAFGPPKKKQRLRSHLKSVQSACR